MRLTEDKLKDSHWMIVLLNINQMIKIIVLYKFQKIIWGI